MRIKLAIIFVLLFLFYIAGGQAAAVTVEGQKSKNEELLFPKNAELIENDISYISILRLVESVGAQISGQPSEGKVAIRIGDKSIYFDKKNEQMQLSNGQVHTAKLLYKDENIYIPSKLVFDFFGYKVLFIDESKYAGNVGEERLPVVEKAVPNATVMSEVNEKPKVYLTFDDGPNQDINPILDTLQEKGAKATFFMLEPLMKQYSTEVKRLVAEGHYPALHSVSHNRELLYEGDPMNITREMEATRKTLYEITGIDSKLTRVPYGSKPFLTDPLREGLVQGEFKMWDWTVDTEDWKLHKSNPQEIVQNVKEGIETAKQSGQPIIVLMHVNKGTASVLPEIIDYIHSIGYECSAYNPSEHLTVNFWNDVRL